MGENGAGKSTLIKIDHRRLQARRRRLLLDGSRWSLSHPRATRSRRHQCRPSGAQSHPALLGRREHPARAVADRRRPGRLRRANAPRRGAFLDHARSDIDTRTEVGDLSVAQMQIVEIAKALRLKAKVLLLDEPTASITAATKPTRCSACCAG